MLLPHSSALGLSEARTTPAPNLEVAPLLCARIFWDNQSRVVKVTKLNLSELSDLQGNLDSRTAEIEGSLKAQGSDVDRARVAGVYAGAALGTSLGGMEGQLIYAYDRHTGESIIGFYSGLAGSIGRPTDGWRCGGWRLRF